jgi:hypothetical protein
MKLKRFLLRYDPPGIGLEVEDDEGKLEVKHKPLSPIEDIKSEVDILALAEEVCASEPGLLNARKHRGSLLQLLGRLYQVQAFSGAPRKEVSTPESEKNDASPASKEQEPVACSAPDTTIEAGRQVVLTGLRGKLESYNGQVGSVLKVKGGKDKYEVAMEPRDSDQQGEVLKIKGSEHLLCVMTVGQTLPPGTCMVLSGLRNHPELNGSIGRVVETHEEGQESPTHDGAGRKPGKAMVEIRTADTNQLFRVKRENVVPVEAAFSTSQTPGCLDRLFPHGALEASPSNDALGANVELLSVGCIVEIVGLKSNMSFNGEQAKIVAVDRETMRYEVRMSDDSMKKLKAENARLVAFAPSSPLANTPSPNGAGLMVARGHGSGSAPNTMKYADKGKRKANELEKLVREPNEVETTQILRYGSTVLLTGLKNAAHLNGAFAMVTQDLGDRAEIQLEDGSLKKVKKECVEVVAGRQ